MCFSNCKYENSSGECSIGNRRHFPSDANCEIEYLDDENDDEDFIEE